MLMIFNYTQKDRSCLGTIYVLSHSCSPEARSREERTDKLFAIICYHTYKVERLMPYRAQFLLIFEIFHIYLHFGRQAS